MGKDNYLLFLTADHGAAHNWKFMEDHGLNGGPFRASSVVDDVEKVVKSAFGNGKNVISTINSYRIFLDHKSIADQNLDLQKVKDVIVEYLRTVPNVEFVIDYERAQQQSLPAIIRDRAMMGYHYRRSGDILVVCEPGYYEYFKSSSPVGTTHGEWNPYDAHIPMLFYGWHVPHGESSKEVHITDIAPTVCQMLHIQQPNACVGEARPFE